MQATKSIFVSKTFWFGVLQVIFGGVGLVTGWIDSQAAMALIISGFGMIGFRKVTTQGVH